MIDQGALLVAEFLDGCRIGKLDYAVGVECYNRIMSTIDHGVISGVLPLAQKPVAFGDDGDIRNLDQAALRAGSKGPHGDIM